MITIFQITALMVFAPAVLLADSPDPRAKKEASAEEILAALPKDSPLDAKTMDFDVTMNGQTIGFMVASLTPTSKGGNKGFDYHVESVMKLPNGMFIDSLITAQLTGTFEPLEVEFRREVRMADGRRELAIDRAQLHDKVIELSRETTEGASPPRSVSRPAVPLVFGIEFLVQRIDLNRHATFALNEFNFQDGTVIVQHFNTEFHHDKTMNLISREDNGDIGYAFALDPKGELVSWAEPPLPAISTQCSKSRVVELRQQFRRP